ncbi:MAG TPA: LuxR C-terminal-related transcriptional regulator [Dehalococcoidia bacterium]|nr:LuxR C-terminal-related transcriptional regulator [Dehalococcoidia bacterium]
MSNLPVSPTPLIGREDDATAVRDLLVRTDVRLLTLVGPAGIGKTRLALEAASRAMPAFADGVFFVDLTPVDEPARLVNAIASSLDVQEGPAEPLEAQLKRYLSSRQLLLVLDNFEQIVVAAPTVADLLVNCPGLKVMVTSRVPLQLSWERRFPVPALTLPEAGSDTDLAHLAQSSAVALFLDRARALQPELALSRDNAAAIVDICARLDGLPLAIELAAAHVDVLSPRAIRDGLRDSGLDILSGGARDLPRRHQTLRDAIAWSERLLEPQEREAFQRLAVFVGGFTGDAAAVVCGDPDAAAVQSTIASLVRKNLLRFEPDEGASGRYRMLEMVREFALEQLREAELEVGSRLRHLEWCLGLAEQAEPNMHERDQKYWLDLLEQEHDNMRSALVWCQRTHRTEAGLRLVAALGWFWRARGFLFEGSSWCEIFLESPPGDPTALRMRALIQAAGLANREAHLERLAEYSGAALLIARALQDRAAESWSLGLLARPALGVGDYGQGRVLAEASVAAAEASGDVTCLRFSLFVLGHAMRQSGELDDAAALYNRTEVLCRDSGDFYHLMWTLINSGILARERALYDTAAARFREALVMARDFPSKPAMGHCFMLLGHLAGITGYPERAARLRGASEAIAERTGEGYAGSTARESRVQSVRALLGAEQFAALDSEGRAWSEDEAIAYALEPDEPQPRTTAIRIDLLTPREAEIAALISQGLTDHQIADLLVISVRTAERHVGNILGKLGLATRTQVATWALHHSPQPNT